MSEAIYKRVGRRYKEVGQFDNEALYYPHGAHLVVCRPGSQLTKYNINPDHAAVDAAMVRVKDAMTKAMHKATELQPAKRPYSKKELAGIAAYQAIAGNPISLRFEGASMSDVVDAAIAILKAEVVK